MSEYDYGNARLRAMRSRLLSRRETEALADINQLPGLIAALLKTAYRKTVEVATTRASGMACITEALHHDLVENLGKTRKFYSGHALEQVAIMLRRYDVHNLKAILRGQSKGVSPGEITGTLLPLGELGSAVLDELLRAPGPRAVIDTLATLRLPIGQPLLDLRAEHPGAEVSAMELALERWHFAEARERLRALGGDVRVLTAAFDLEADLINLLTALRFVHTPLERQMLQIAMGTSTLRDLLVTPGRLPLDLLAQIGARDTLPAAVDLLGSTPYASPLRAGLVLYQQSNRLSDIEKQLRRYRLRRLSGLIVQDPLGIGVILGYFALKIAEIGNIRWVAQGISLGLPAESIKVELEFAT